MAGTTCPHCRGDLMELIRRGMQAGDPAKCPHCGQSISVPAGERTMRQGTSSLPKQSYEGSGGGYGRFDRKSII